MNYTAEQWVSGEAIADIDRKADAEARVIIAESGLPPCDPCVLGNHDGCDLTAWCSCRPWHAATSTSGGTE